MQCKSENNGISESSKNKETTPRACYWLAKPFEHIHANLTSKTKNTCEESNNLKPDFHYDVLIIGSGYGGSIAAEYLSRVAELAVGVDDTDESLRIAVFERGKEYLDGSFPSSGSDLPGHVRFSTINSPGVNGIDEGLFDIRLGQGINVVQANGLGGGSLINAGVMVEPNNEVFDQRWPVDIQEQGLAQYYKEARLALGASVNSGNSLSRVNKTDSINDDELLNTFEAHADADKIQKFNFMKQVGARAVPITIATDTDTHNNYQAGVKLNNCIACGDCATGCNAGAKISLDKNLLFKAAKQGVEIYTSATATQLIELENGWEVEFTHTNKKLRHRDKPIRLRAKKVIVAAGALGSTELLLKSKSRRLSFSQKLGQGFSGNGDLLAFSSGHNDVINVVAKDGSKVNERFVGPTITSSISMQTGENKPFLLEEMAIPYGLKMIFSEIVKNANTIGSLLDIEEVDRFNYQRDVESSNFDDPFSLKDEFVQRSSVYALISDDGAKGSLELIQHDDLSTQEKNSLSDGQLAVRWSSYPNLPYFQQKFEAFSTLIKANGCDKTDFDKKKKVLAHPTPTWQLFPDSIQGLMAGENGPLITVHPLGGCAMADDANQGVVNQWGQVFKGVSDSENKSDEVYHNLVVLDGSIMPCALGANPALTISALAIRSMHALGVKWFGVSSEQAGNIELENDAVSFPVERPSYKSIDFARCPDDEVIPTEIEVTERLTGNVKLDFPLSGSSHLRSPSFDAVVELTLRFLPTQVKKILVEQDRKLIVNTDSKEQGFNEPVSEIRIYRKDQWQAYIHQGKSDDAFDEIALLKAPLSGYMHLMGREQRNFHCNRLQVYWAWFRNRGARDLYQAGLEFFCSIRTKADKSDQNYKQQAKKEPKCWISKLYNYYQEIKALASRASEVRLFDYELKIDPVSATGDANLIQWLKQEDPSQLLIKGRKYITYNRRANPLRQFEDLHLHEFPKMLEPTRKKPYSTRPSTFLRYDSRFLTHYQKPLICVVQEQDQIQSMADMTSFSLHFFRLLMSNHLWSFRKPDAQEQASHYRFPKPVKGLPKPIITEVCVDSADVGQDIDLPVNIRLTRYAGKSKQAEPIVFIHGYSVSGNTFTHNAIDMNAATFFWRKGYDVWVLDLRSSSAMATAMIPWKFEDIAFADIPVAIEHIYGKTQRKVHVLAHCMGAAMLSMAVLSKPKSGEAFYHEREALPERLGRVVLSQIGPKMVFTPENIFRAYGLQYLKNMSGQLFYQFRRSDQEKALEVLLDRLLASLPYPDDEYDIENPFGFWKTTPFVGTRHRIDGLYARTFSLKNMPKKVLNALDELFGPLSMVTLMQTIYFAKKEVITDQYGQEVYATTENLKARWVFDTLSIHGDENGLADVSTLGRMKTFMQDSPAHYETYVCEGFGHQDSLIGHGAVKNFEVIEKFISRAAKESKESDVSKEKRKFSLQPISHGPIVSVNNAQKLKFGFGVEKKEFKHNALLALPVLKLDVESDNQLRLWQFGYEKAELQALEHDQFWFKKAIDSDIYENFKSELDLDQQKIASIDSNCSGILLLHCSSITPLHSLENVYERLSKVLREKVESLCLDDEGISLSIIKPSVWHSVDSDHQLIIALSACQYPSGLFDRKLAYRSYKNLKSVQDERPMDALLLFGDQIYADASAGFCDPLESYNRYDKAYLHWLSQPEVRSTLSSIPTACMLDDHEIINDWDLTEGQLQGDVSLSDGELKYKEYQRPDISLNLANCQNYYEFEKNGFAFFMMDTRTERSGRALVENSMINTKFYKDAHIISESQWLALERWLSKQDKLKPKFIASPSMLVPRRLESEGASVIRSDAWDGYPESQQRLFKLLVKLEQKNVIFLSGDEHLSNFTQFSLSSPEIETHSNEESQKYTYYSIHSSAFYAPFPFANSSEELFMHHSSQNFDDMTMDVEKIQFCQGDGFATLELKQRSNGRWLMSCSFYREGKNLDLSCEVELF